MKNRSLLVLLAVGLASQWGIAQSSTASDTPADDSKPSTLNIVGQQYPRVSSDLRATFRLKAPDAQKVRLHLDKDYDMEKKADGVWSVTSGVQAPGFHYYWFILDGVNVCDPASETFFGVGRQYGGIEIPSKGEDFYDAKDVPHGDVRVKWYYAKSTNAWRRCFVYTPPGYDDKPDARYPVLYLQHGGGEDERGWVIQGRVGFIMDNLIAEGKAKPMMIVMDNGGVGGMFPGRGRGGPGGTNSTGGAATNRPPPGGPFGGRGGFAGAFGKIMTNDLIPMIDSSYRTIANRDHRGMAGLSMGGMQTAQITLNNLDLFSYIGTFSSGGVGDPKTAGNGVMTDAAAFNEKVKLLFISVGTAENAGSVRTNHIALDNAGIKNVFYESPGTAHEWLTWRRSLREMAPLLFQN